MAVALMGYNMDLHLTLDNISFFCRVETYVSYKKPKHQVSRVNKRQGCIFCKGFPPIGGGGETKSFEPPLHPWGIN